MPKIDNMRLVLGTESTVCSLMSSKYTRKEGGYVFFSFQNMFILHFIQKLEDNTIFQVQWHGSAEIKAHFVLLSFLTNRWMLLMT